MPIYTDSFKNNFDFHLDSDVKINDLDKFKESLERYLLSEVTVRKCSLKDRQCDLVIGIHFNFSLNEMISCLKYQNIVNEVPKGDVPHKSTVFFNALSKLYKENSIGLDVVELALYLKDTAIIIEKIYHQSIPDQLENILKSLAENYLELVDSKAAVPYEIYIPVFEEDATEMENTLRNISSDNNNQKDYFGFWGLYFESEEDAVIYDVAAKAIQMGDLFMLNH